MRIPLSRLVLKDNIPAGAAPTADPTACRRWQRIAVRGSHLTTWGATYAFNTVLVTVPYANIEGN